MEITKAMTWKDLSLIEEGTIIKDWFEGNIRCLIVRGPASLCAYLGVPIGHPLAGFGYDNIPLRVHGGLTFSKEGDGTIRPSGYYWYGWDYAHAGDYCFYYNNLDGGFGRNDKKWMVEDVEHEVRMALYDFKELVSLSEALSK